MRNRLFAVAALFESPDKIIKAADAVASQGFRKFDVNTPYPVHGMDKAMKLKPSKLGFVTLFFGLTGTAIGLILTYWTMSVDYPLVIGGKPFFALPAFIPILFELTVLLATLATVFGMFAFFFNLPHNDHPIHDTEYMKMTSYDKYGIYIESADENFDESKIKRLFTDLGATKIYDLAYPEKITYPIFEPKFVIFLIITFVAVSGATYLTLNKLLYVTPFNWMMDQLREDVQDVSQYLPDQPSMRIPVQGTVARGFIPYPYKGINNPTEVLTNPILPTQENLNLGRNKYLSYCSPCHGNFGNGDSRLRGQFPNPPTLHSKRAREFSDGMIYHIITNGQNVMPSYESQVTREERWAIVNYIRVLQRAKNAQDSDLEVAKKEFEKNAAK